MDALKKRFWAKVKVLGPDDCWEWQARRNDDGYGEIGVSGSKQRAHRISARWAGQDIDGKVVRHSCDNPPCVNPAHLLIGTQADNVADMLARDRFVSGESKVTHCPRGHPYAGENLYMDRKGGRCCRECHRAKQRDYQRAKRATMLAVRNEHVRC